MQASKAQLTSEPIQDYINRNSLRLTRHQKKLIERTFKTPASMMRGSLDGAQFFQLLLKSINAKRVIELGTFTGYTTLTMALALPQDGRIITCDINDKYIATDIWHEAGVDQKIIVKIGPAAKTLEDLLASGLAETVDFIFIDADKSNQLNYYELSLQLLRRGGIIAIDNVLWSGAVADDGVQDSTTTAIRQLNEFVKNDKRVEVSMLRLGDGTTFCYKK